MSDTEENPLEETEEYGEIEMQEEDDEEEEYPNFEGLGKYATELKEVNTLAWIESPEEEEEEGGGRRRREGVWGRGRSRGWGGRRGGDKRRGRGGQEREGGGRGRREGRREWREHGRRKRQGRERKWWKDWGRRLSKTKHWRQMRRPQNMQEESTVEPEEITSMISLERFMVTDSQTVLSETSSVSRNCHSFIQVPNH